MAKIIQYFSKPGQVDFDTPVQDGTATAKVNGITATISSQTNTRVTLATPTSHNDKVEITYNPVEMVGVTRTERQVPVTGNTVSPSNLAGLLILEPAGTLATLTVNFPSGPVDNQAFTIFTTQTLTALSFGNGTVVGAPTTLAANGSAHFRYSTATSKWYKV